MKWRVPMRAHSRVAKKSYRSNGFTESRGGRRDSFGKASRSTSRDRAAIREMIAR